MKLRDWIGIGAIITVALLVLTGRIPGCGSPGRPDATTRDTLYLPDTLGLKLRAITIDSLRGEVAVLRQGRTRAQKESAEAKEWARKLERVVASLQDPTDSIFSIDAGVDTAASGKGTVTTSRGDTAEVSYTLRFGIRYNVGLDLWHDMKARIDSMTIGYLKPVETVTTIKYERYIPWEFVGPAALIVAIAIHLILK